MNSIRAAWSSSVLQIRRRPGSAAAVVAVLGLGVVAWALSLVFFDATQRQPTAFPNSAELVDVLASTSRDPGRRVSPTLRDALAWREGSRSFVSFGLYQPFGSVDGVIGGVPRRLRVQRATADYFSTLGVPTAAGRTFQSDEEGGAKGPMAVLSERLARELAGGGIGGIGGIVGERLKLDGVEHEIVGVMPRGFTTRGGVPDLWLALPAVEAEMGRAVGGVARLAPGVSLTAARTELASVAAGANPSVVENRTLPDLLPLVEVLRAPTRRLATLLLWVGLAVLVTGAVNAAGLLSGRFLARRRELTIRVGLGATEKHARGLLIGEGTLLVGLAMLAGFAVLALVLPLLPDLRGLYLHDSVTLRLGGWVALLVSVATTLLGGSAVLLAAAPTGEASLRGAHRLGTAGPSHGAVRTQRRLVGLQIAATAALLVVATNLAEQAYHLTTVPTGLDPRNTLSWELSPSRDRHRTPAAVGDLLRRLESDLSALPGVAAIGVAHAPPDDSWGYGARPADRPQEEPVPASFLLVSRDWRRAMGLTLLRGRDFANLDQGVGAPKVALVSETAAARLFPTEHQRAVGKAVLFDGVAHEIIGVVAEVRIDPLQRRDPTPGVYVLLAQHLPTWAALGPRQLHFALRGVTTTPGTEPVLSVLRAIDPEQPIVALQPLAERLAAPLRRPRLAAGVVSLLSSLALVLAALGLASVIALDVDRRKREIGVRKACGARCIDVLRWVARRAASPVATGLVLGLATGAAALRLWGGIEAGRVGLGGWTYLLVAAAVAVIALAAIATPAWRAVRVSPTEVLRCE